MKKIEYLIEKFDKLANKIGKHNVMLILFITVVLLISGLYSTFSLFTTLEGIEIINGLKTYKFVLDSELSETSVIIPANSSKSVDIIVSNKDKQSLLYGIYYNSSNSLSNVTIGYLKTSLYPVNGTIEAGGNYTVTIKVMNDSSSNVTINFGLSYGILNGGDLILPSGSNWIKSYYLNTVPVGSYVKYVGSGGNVGTSRVACKTNGTASSSTEGAATESKKSCSGQNAREDTEGTSTTYGYCGNSDYHYTVTGWRIAYIDNNNKAVIVSAGSPECNVLTSSVANVTYIKTANAKALKYCNTAYVDGDCSCESTTSGQCSKPSTDAWAINDSDFYYMTKAINGGFGKRLIETSSNLGDVGGATLGSIVHCTWTSAAECGLGNDLIDNGGYYWFASQFSSWQNAGVDWNPGSKFTSNSNSDDAYGLRPMISLSSNVVVTGGSGTMYDPYTISKGTDLGIDTLGEANEPLLDEGMIPVSFDPASDLWRKADSSNVSNSWYDYDAKQWANVLIKDSNTILDKSDNANHATLAAKATWNKEEETVTTHASANTDFVNLGLDGYDFGTNFSFVIRVKFNALSTSAENWFFANNQSGGWGAYITSAGLLAFRLQVGSTNYNCVSGTTVVIDTWYTIVGTYDGANVNLYLDGELVAEQAQTVVPTVVAFPFIIGGNPNADKVVDTSTDTAVTVSDVLIFTRALTATEVANDYAGVPDPSDKSDLLVLHDFNDEFNVGTALWSNTSPGNFAFYTWIPRFKYRVWNINRQAGGEDTYAYPAYSEGIDIMFENGKSSTGNVECTYDDTTTVAAGYLNDICTFQKDTAIETTSVNADFKDAWYTHPAFTFGGREKTGFWVGKFEITGSTTVPTVLPNVTSIRSQSLSALFTTARLFQNYGLSDKIDAHIITNLEWGALSYLTQSIYGLCDNNGCRDVYANNSSSFYTGRSSGELAKNSTASANGTYDYMGYTLADSSVARNESIVASTTGNITGVYDMSGGGYETVMGNMVSSNKVFYPLSSGTSWSGSSTLNAKYYNSYAYYGTDAYSQASFNRARLGDATAEVVGATGSDYSAWQPGLSITGSFSGYPYSSSYSWLIRGGYSGKTYNGIFYFNKMKGAPDSNGTSRVVIS